MRTLFALVVLAPGLYAQFTQLVMPSDGSRVVFSSRLSLKSDPAHNWSKLFEATASGVGLLEERFPTEPHAPVPMLETFYEVLSRDQSSDGAVQATNTYRTCVGGSRCVYLERFNGEIRAPWLAAPLMRGGMLRLSADGHYAFSFGSTGPVPLHAILDLWTSSVVSLPLRPVSVAPSGRRVIANNGTAVFLDGNGAVMLASREAVVTLAKTSLAASSAIIDNDGRYVVYETAAETHQLMLYDIGAGRDISLVWADEGCTQPGLSDDGRRMLFLSAANWEAANDGQRVQAWMFDLTTGELQQLTQDAAGVAEATLSGDGRVVWAVTLAGRLLRVETDSGTVAEVVGRTVALDGSREICPQPSQCVLAGRGLASSELHAAEPFSFTLGGVEVKVDGIPVPLISVAPDEVHFLLPWELQADEHRWEITPGDSIFQEKNVLVTSLVR